MKTKIAGYTTIVFIAGWLIFLVYAFISEFKNTEITIGGMLPYGLIVLTLTPMALYIKWTKFGNINIDEAAKIERENIILQKKIEQKKLQQLLNQPV